MWFRSSRLGVSMLLAMFLSECVNTPQKLAVCLSNSTESVDSAEFFKRIIDIAANTRNEKECVSKVVRYSEDKVDFENIARRSCTKKYYNELKSKDPEALEYMKAMIINTVLIITKKYDKSKIVVGKSKITDSTRNKKESFSVTVNGEKYTVVFVISKKSGRIVDIICENVSLVGMLKTQFYEYIKKHGVENFLEKCKQVQSKISGNTHANRS